MQIRSKLFYTYVAFVLLYAASFVFNRPIATLQRLELSDLEYRLISLSILIPLALIWFAAFYGYNKLRAYTNLIKDSPDGKYVACITTGLMILAIGLPLNSLISASISITIQHNPWFMTAGTIIKNYFSLLFPLVSFLFISRGTQGLTLLSKKLPTYKAVNRFAVIFIVISAVYCCLTMASPIRHTTYHLPDWLIVTTIICPYLYTWFLGLSAAYETHLYSRKAPGTLYRSTWNMLASGIACIIIAQVVVQYVGNILLRFNDLKLFRLLLIVYVLLGLLSVGYLLVAVGAKRLQKIEEV